MILQKVEITFIEYLLLSNLHFGSQFLIKSISNINIFQINICISFIYFIIQFIDKIFKLVEESCFNNIILMFIKTFYLNKSILIKNN